MTNAPITPTDELREQLQMLKMIGLESAPIDEWAAFDLRKLVPFIEQFATRRVIEELKTVAMHKGSPIIQSDDGFMVPLEERIAELEASVIDGENQ